MAAALVGYAGGRLRHEEADATRGAAASAPRGGGTPAPGRQSKCPRRVSESQPDWWRALTVTWTCRRRSRGWKPASPVATANSVAAGSARWRSRGRRPRDDLLLVLLSGGASALSAVPAPGLFAGRQAGRHAATAPGGGGHPRAQHRPKAPLGIQGRPARGSDCRPHARARRLGRRRRQSECHRFRAHRSRCQHLRRGARLLDGPAAQPPIRPRRAGAARWRTRCAPRHAQTRGRAPAPLDDPHHRVAGVGGSGCGARRGGAGIPGHRARGGGRGGRAGRRAEVVAAAVRLAGERLAPACDITTGETTVKVAGRGRGGRNQELVSRPLSRSPRVASRARC